MHGFVKRKGVWDSMPRAWYVWVPSEFRRDECPRDRVRGCPGGSE